MVLQQLLEGFVPITALYPIMFERVGGLNFQQIGFLFAIWGIVYLMFELPSGMLADYWSRKYVIAIGDVARGIGLSLWIFWPTFTGYAIGFGLWGVQIAFSSGAASAYLENELKHVGKEKYFTKYFGWATAAFWAGMLAGHGISALLTLDNADFLMWLGVVSSVLSGLIMLLGKESPYKKQSSYFGTLIAGVAEIRGSKQLLYVSGVLFSVYTLLGVVEELVPRVYSSFGLSDSAVSLTLAIALLLTVVLVARLESVISFSIPKQVGLMALGALILTGGLLVGDYPGVFLVLLFSLIFQVFRPLFQHHVISFTKSNEKATVSSIPGIVGGLVGAAGYFSIGLLSVKFGEEGSIALYAAFWLCVLVFLMILGSRVMQKPSNSGDSGHERIVHTSIAIGPEDHGRSL